MIIKKKKNQAKLNAIAENFSLKKLVYIQGSPALCQPFFPYKPHTQTFLTFQSKWAPEEDNYILIIIQLSELDIQPSSELSELLTKMSSLFIHVTNLKITITKFNSKFCIYYLKSWHFLNNWVSNFLGERSSTICASSSYNFGMKNWSQEFRSGVSYYTTFHKT